MEHNQTETEAWERLRLPEGSFESKERDAINPNHYKTGNVECIDAIAETMSAEALGGFLQGNCIKYLWRYKTKHPDRPIEDLRKAQWYLNMLIEQVGK
tara:strand:- start:296 stop:589 length:294 start_codon:yes stop_codon:yes gene_type:complete